MTCVVLIVIIAIVVTNLRSKTGRAGLHAHVKPPAALQGMKNYYNDSGVDIGVGPPGGWRLAVGGCSRRIALRASATSKTRSEHHASGRHMASLRGLRSGAHLILGECKCHVRRPCSDQQHVSTKVPLATIMLR